MSEIPHRVLSEEFQSVVAGRRVRAAAFLTFRFDPGFFEQEILPAFLDVSLSHVPEVRLLNLAEALRTVDAVAVYYDRRALEAGARSGKLDIQRVAVSQTTGYFHPKNVLVLVDNPRDDDEHPATQSLIVAALSANLTRAGWWENVEVAHVAEVLEGEPCSFRDDVRRLIASVRRIAAHIPEHPALDAIDTFLRRVPTETQRIRDRLVLPRLLSGESFIEFLTNVAGNRLRQCNLEVLSPYFDDTESSAGALVELEKAFRPREIRVFLPKGLESEALCSAAYFDNVKKIATWGTLPDSVMRLSKTTNRTLHAKVYRFFDRDSRYEALFVGSVNLTSPAFKPGNFESGFFVEVPTRKRPDWWLAASSKPAAFKHRGEDEGLAQGAGWRLTLRYNWQQESADAFWDSSTAAPALTLRAHGVEIGRIERLAPREWTPLAKALADALSRELKASSFITVRIDGQEDTEILVEEERMTHKPSLMATLSADDIIRYWSFLTHEQKQEFLEEHAAELVNDPELALWIAETRGRDAADSFFSTFTEIYISFGNLRTTVASALEQKREREAVDRLFGNKFDSLRRLIERLMEEEQPDPVRAYITVLCAKQLLDGLEPDHREFAAANRSDLKNVRELVERARDLRHRLSVLKQQDGDQFLVWFERWFLARAEPVAQT